MNLKKYLQKQAEKDAEALLTEEDRLLCLQLAQMDNESDTKEKDEVHEEEEE